jgi:DNA-binding transcriptional ArsR family regulator
MTKHNLGVGALEPEDIFMIDTLDTLKVVADPLRLHILELLRGQPHTVKQLATALRTPLKKLYYHVNLLEEHGLIRVSATRVVSGIIEKQYQVTAYRLSVDRTLLSPAAEAQDDGLDAFLSMILDQTKSEIKKSVRAGLVELGSEKSMRERGLVLGRRWMRLSPERADLFIARLKELEQEFEVPELASDPDARFYELLIGFYQTEPPDKRQSGDSLESGEGQL